MRLELTRGFPHYPLKVACIPISPPGPEFTNFYMKSVFRGAKITFTLNNDLKNEKKSYFLIFYNRFSLCLKVVSLQLQSTGAVLPN